MRMLATRCSCARKRQRLAHDLIQFDGRPRGVALPRKGLQVADDAGGAFGGVVNRIEIATRAFVEFEGCQPLGAREDRRERIVQLVRHAGHRLAQRRQFLGLQKLLVDVARLILEPSCAP